MKAEPAVLKPYEFWTLTAAGLVAIVLAAVNMTLFAGNRGLQQQANQRGQYIQQSVALENLYRDLLQGLAQQAVRTRDEQVRDLLAAEGVKVAFDTSAPPAAAP